MTIRALKRRNLANNLVHLKDGVEACDYLFGEGACANKSRGGLPKLVLLDIKMPRMDGLEVLERIKTDTRTRNIPVVMLTSSKEERDVIQSYNFGVNSYITKPVDFNKFSEAVSDLGFYWMILNTPPKNA